MIMQYIHERDDWPDFRWDEGTIAAKLAAVRHRQGRLLGRMEGLGFDLRNEAMLRTLTQDVVKSSEIEGEVLGPTGVGETQEVGVVSNDGNAIRGVRDIDYGVLVTEQDLLIRSRCR